jgi:hypothetical protein
MEHMEAKRIYSRRNIISKTRTGRLSILMSSRIWIDRWTSEDMKSWTLAKMLLFRSETTCQVHFTLDAWVSYLVLSRQVACCSGVEMIKE